jgi:hypothetical protein
MAKFILRFSLLLDTSNLKKILVEVERSALKGMRRIGDA